MLLLVPNCGEICCPFVFVVIVVITVTCLVRDRRMPQGSTIVLYTPDVCPGTPLPIILAHLSLMHVALGPTLRDRGGQVRACGRQRVRRVCVCAY